MYPQSPVPAKIGQNGIGNVTDPHLKGGPIFYKGGHMGPDLLFQGGDFSNLVFMYGPVHLNGILDLVDMDDPIPMGTGHPGIDQGHHGLSHLNGRKGDVHRDPQGTIAVPVGRGYLNEGHVQGQDAPSEKKMDLTEENGHIVPAMAVDETADVAPDK